MFFVHPCSCAFFFEAKCSKKVSTAVEEHHQILQDEGTKIIHLLDCNCMISDLVHPPRLKGLNKFNSTNLVKLTFIICGLVQVCTCLVIQSHYADPKMTDPPNVWDLLTQYGKISLLEKCTVGVV